MTNATHTKRRRLAITAAIASLAVASFLIFHHRAQSPIRTFTFSANVSATNIIWIDEGSFLALTNSTSGHPTWTRYDLRTGKSYPLTDLLCQPSGSLLWRMVYSRAVISPDGKLIAGCEYNTDPWVYSSAKVLTPLPPATKPAMSMMYIFGSFQFRGTCWTLNGKHRISRAWGNHIEIFDRAGRMISNITEPSSTPSFTELIGETAEGNVILQPPRASNVSEAVTKLISIDAHTGKSHDILLERPEGVGGDTQEWIEVSQQGDRLAWLTMTKGRDYIPGLLHGTLLHIGIDTTPKSRYIVEVMDLDGRNAHVITNIDATDTLPGGFGWMPGGRSVYLDICTDHNLSNKPGGIQKAMNFRQRIMVIPAD